MINEKQLASKVVKWLNYYFGDRDHLFFQVFPEIPTLQFDRLLAGDRHHPTSCPIATTIDCILHKEWSDYTDGDTLIEVTGETITISLFNYNGVHKDVHINPDDEITEFIWAFDDGDCPSYDINIDLDDGENT